MKLCITTVCSNDHYSYYLPMFVYTAQRAYPEYHVKVFVRGYLNDVVKNTLKMVKGGNYTIVENVFKKYPDRTSVCNTLRHLIPQEHFEGFDYVYITDIDFLLFRHSPTLGEYFAHIIKKTGQPYASFRGPLGKPYRPYINATGWKGNFTRIADGTLMLKTPEWFNMTNKARSLYAKLVRNSKHDTFDKIIPASYREYNEVMLYRICKLSKIKTPTKRRKFLDGSAYNDNYRDIHLGDMKFNYTKRLKRKLTNENEKNFKALEKDTTWIALSEICSQCSVVKKSLHYLRKYVGV